MNIEELFPSKYVKASDLSQPQTLRISGIEMEKMSDGEMKPVLYFGNSTKGLVLNVTNKNVIKELYGSDTDNWEGKPIQLIATTTDFGGKVVDCIRLRPPKAAVASAAAEAAIKASEPFAGADLDDEIPF
jgi:hypothetical protein